MRITSNARIITCRKLKWLSGKMSMLVILATGMVELLVAIQVMKLSPIYQFESVDKEPKKCQLRDLSNFTTSKVGCTNLYHAH